MKPYIALMLLVASLTACAREAAQAPSPIADSRANPASMPSVAQAATAAAADAASVSDAVVAAKTQQEGADTGKGTDSGETALERVAALPAEGQLPAGKWVAGTNYKVLSPAQPTDVAPGKVEVVEVFWYGCPHCYALDPFIDSWLKNKAPYIQFVRVPVMWGEVHRAHARLFYTLQALGKLEELHAKVFDTIHQQRNPLFAPGDEKATLQQQLAFAKANGISESDFLTAYNSFGVQTNLQKADDLTRRDRIDGVPTMVINGHYASDVGMAGNQDNLIQLTNELAGSEKHH
jgi:thiol:disulfide interchange protein DsbA